MTVLRLLSQREHTKPSPKGLALDGAKKKCYTANIRRANMTVLEFFAVGNNSGAFLFWTVKGGVVRDGI